MISLFGKKKTCSVCKKALPLSDFYNNKNTRDGKACRCKKCDNERHKQWVEQKKRMSSSDWLDKTIGGCTIYILNNPISGEFKYNVVFTNGHIYQTQDRDEFLVYMGETF
jgi:hypothetical protein